MTKLDIEILLDKFVKSQCFEISATCDFMKSFKEFFNLQSQSHENNCIGIRHNNKSFFISHLGKEKISYEIH